MIIKMPMRSRLCDLRFLGCAWGNLRHHQDKTLKSTERWCCFGYLQWPFHGGKEYIWERPLTMAEVIFQYLTRLQNFLRTTEKGNLLKNEATADTLVRVSLKQCRQMLHKVLLTILHYVKLSRASCLKNCVLLCSIFRLKIRLWFISTSIVMTQWRKSENSLMSARWQYPSDWKNCSAECGCLWKHRLRIFIFQII